MKRDKKEIFFNILNLIVLWGLLFSLIPAIFYENKQSKVILTQNDKDIFVQYFQRYAYSNNVYYGCFAIPVQDTNRNEIYSLYTVLTIYNDRTVSFRAHIDEDTSFEDFTPIFSKISEQDFQKLIDRIEKPHLLTLDNEYHFNSYNPSLVEFYEDFRASLNIYTATAQKEFHFWTDYDNYALGLGYDFSESRGKYNYIQKWESINSENLQKLKGIKILTPEEKEELIKNWGKNQSN